MCWLLPPPILSYPYIVLLLPWVAVNAAQDKRINLVKAGTYGGQEKKHTGAPVGTPGAFINNTSTHKF